MVVRGADDSCSDRGILRDEGSRRGSACLPAGQRCGGGDIHVRYVHRGELLLCPVFAHYKNSNEEHAPNKLGGTSDKDYRGVIDATFAKRRRFWSRSCHLPGDSRPSWCEQFSCDRLRGRKQICSLVPAGLREATGGHETALRAIRRCRPFARSGFLAAAKAHG